MIARFPLSCQRSDYVQVKRFFHDGTSHMWVVALRGEVLSRLRRRCVPVSGRGRPAGPPPSPSAPAPASAKQKHFFFFLDTRTTSSRASLDQPPRTSTGPTPEECPHVSLLLLTPSLQPVRTRAPNTSQRSYVHVFNPGVCFLWSSVTRITEVKHAYCLLTAIDG